jgi:hypothetical protein
MPHGVSRWILPALLLACFANQAPAQDPQQSTLQALLNEVKLLRVALERSNQLAPRIQIALARMQFQEERVRSATRRVEAAHDELSNAQRRRSELAATLKALESRQSLALDANARKEVEDQMASIKAELERFVAIEEQNSTREGESLAALQSEQAKWNEVNDQLVSLDRGLTAP